MNQHKGYPAPMVAGKQHQSKSRHIMILNNLKKKEEQWDQRFYINKIPEYDAAYDQNCETYNQQQQSRISFAPGGRIRKNHNDISSNQGYSNVRQQQRGSAEKSQIQSKSKVRVASVSKRLYGNKTDQGMEDIAQNQYQELKKLWEDLDVPINHREIFLEIIRTNVKQKAIDILTNEIEDIKNQRSFIQNCMQMVQNRENSLLKIKSLIQQINSCQTVDMQLVDQCSEQITNLRLNTITSVECIQAWRDYLNNNIKSKHPVHMPYLYQEENYILKIKIDTEFLRDSIVANYFNFSNKQDPFIINPTINSNHLTQQIQHYISKPMLRRIKACEIIILEETVQQSVPQNQSRKLQQYDSKSPNLFQSNNNSKSRGGLPRPRPLPSHHQKQGSEKNGGTGVRSQQNSDHNIQPQFRVQNGSNSAIHKDLKSGENKKMTQSSENIFKQQQQNNNNSRTPQNKTTQANSQKYNQNQNNNQQQQQQQQYKYMKYEKFMDSEFTFEVCQIEIESLKNIFDKHIQQLHEDQKFSFIDQFDILLKKMQNNQEQSVLLIKKESKVEGIVFLYIDKGCFTLRRMYISHLSCIDMDNFAKIVELTTQYIWKFDPCQEIRVDFYHYETEQKPTLGMNKPLSKLFQLQGFKWKMVQNDTILKKRFTILACKRPEEKVSENKQIQPEPFIIENQIQILYNNSKESKLQNECKTFDIQCTLLSALQGMLMEGEGENNEKLREELKENELLNQKLKQIDILLAKQYPLKDFKPEIQNCENQDKKSYCSAMKAVYRWPEFTFQNYSNYKGIRFFQRENEFIQASCSDLDNNLYIIPKEDEGINYFIFQIKDVQQLNQVGLTEKLKHIFKNLNGQKQVEGDIIIPCFQSKEQKSTQSIEIKNSRKNFQISSSISLQSNYQPCIPNYDIYSQNNIKPNFISPPFVFGAIQTDIEEMLDIPYFASLVTEQDCIQV